MEKKYLNIFIGSPGDLADERQEARNVCQRVNKILRKTINWQVDLLGWEDTLPGANRPQALINEDVQDCDLFVGLLWRRWGQSTGEYSSGFFEEFTLATQLNKENKKPEIWLFFKDINTRELDDPGPQLTKVLDFKRKIESEKELLYKTFKDVNEFKEILHDYLVEYTLKLDKVDNSSEDVSSANLNNNDSSKRMKLQNIYSEDVVKILSESEEDRLLQVSNMNRINLFTSLIISCFQGNVSIDNHVINRVYKQRKEFQLSSSERVGILPSLLGNEYHPGWYWFKDENVRTIYKYIREITVNGTKAQRRIAIKASIRFGINIFIEKNIDTYLNDDLIDILIDGIKDKKVEAEIIKKINDTNDLKLRQKVQIMEYNHLLDSDKEKAERYLSDNVVNNYALLDFFSVDTLEKTSKDIVINIFKHLNENLSNKLVDLIKKDDNFSEEDYFEIFNITKSKYVKNALMASSLEKKYKKLVKEKINEEGIDLKYKIKYYKNENLYYDLDNLNMLTLYEEEKIKLYCILNYDNEKDTIQSLLDNNLSKYRDLLEDYFTNKYTGAKNKDGSLQTFIIDQIIVGLLFVLYYKEDEIAIKYARRYIGNTIYGIGDNISLKIICKYGDVEDYDILKEYIKRVSGEIKWVVAKKILDFKLTNENIIFLIKLGEKSVIDITLTEIKNRSVRIDMSIILELLYNKNEIIRDAALRIILTNNLDLEEVIDKYTDGIYYYNTNKKMDTILYAPKKIREYYISDL
jgi:hypothetical protein